MSWQDQAACKGIDPNVFFPGRGQSLTPAKLVCAQCTVRQECLEVALDTGVQDDFGVWGGSSERQRRRMRAGRQQAPWECQCPHCGEPFTTRDHRRRYCSGCAGRAASAAYRRRRAS